MSDDIEERVSKLEAQVSYLEQATGESYERAKFERKMNRISSIDSFEVNEDTFQGYIAEATVPPSKMRSFVDEVSRFGDIEWVIEHSTSDEIAVKIGTDLER